MWHKVEQFKRTEYFHKALYIIISDTFLLTAIRAHILTHHTVIQSYVFELHGGLLHLDRGLFGLQVGSSSQSAAKCQFNT